MEWLTTGQMIDQLKVGEVAKYEVGDFLMYVTKNEFGSILYCEEDGKFIVGNHLRITADFVGSKWRILPNYVSFEEAMKAFVEGKEITCEIGNIYEDGKISYLLKDQYSYAFTHKQITEGEWTIEGDSE